MPRGQKANVGDERTAKNGYSYVKTADRAWVLKHWLVAEEARGGQHIDPAREVVKFVNGKKDDFRPDNIIVLPKRTSSLRARKASLEAKIADLQGELEYVNKQIEARSIST